MGVVVLDAGVVIAGLDAADAHHAGAARDDDRLGQGRLVPPACLCLRRSVGATCRQGRASTISQVDTALDVAGIAIADADRAIARHAAILRARHRTLRLPDALVIATAIELHADHLLTTDQRWKGLRLGLRGRLTTVT